MLVLYRAKYESLNIGKDIEIKVLEVLEHQVKIGIKAPEGFSIWRTEVGPRKPKATVKSLMNEEKEQENAGNKQSNLNRERGEESRVQRHSER